MSNPNSLHISETGSLKKKKSNLDEVDVRKPLLGSISQNSGQLRLLKPGVLFDNSKPQLQNEDI
jgi:hypothetical protein